MSLYVINSEYDLDNTLKECVKLMYTGDTSKVKIAFNNMGMVQIFLMNLSLTCDSLNINPEESDFSLDVFVGSALNSIENYDDDDDEEAELDGSY